MIHRKLAALFLASFLLAAGVVRADETAAAVKIAKPATVLVLLPDDKGSGSGFCVDKNGVFVTNYHVVRGLPTNARFELILNASETNEKKLTATVIARDKENDLALLMAQNPPADLTSLTLGHDADLVETQQVIALGFPFGTMLAMKGAAPSMSINVARITSLRKSKDGLEVVQIDSQLNPGNSGGPLIDLKGRVVGVNTAGIVASGINFAVPVGRVRALLSVPQLSLKLPKVGADGKGSPQTFHVDVMGGTIDPSKLKVQLVVGAGSSAQTVDMDRGGSTAHFSAKVTPVPAKTGPLQLPCSVDVGGDGPFEALLEDTTLRLGGKSIKLSEIASIERAETQIVVHLKDGGELAKVAPPTARIAGMQDGKKITVDLTKVQNLVVNEPLPVNRIPVAVNVISEGKVVRTVTAELVIDEEPAIAEKPEPKPGKPLKPGADPVPSHSGAAAGSLPPPASVGKVALPTSRPTFDEQQLAVRTDEPFTKFTTAGCGRFVCLYLPKAKTVAVLDIISGTIIQNITGISEDVMMCGGRDKLLLVLPGQGIVQRWNLTTLKREKIAPLPCKGVCTLAVMGGNSAGPLLLGADDTLLVDIESFKPIRYDGELVKTQQPYGYQLNVSADGSLFCGIPKGMGPVSYDAMPIRGRETSVSEFDSTSNAMRFAQPSADGSLIFLPEGEMYSRSLQKVEAKWLADSTCFPTPDPRYFISIKFTGGERKRGKVAEGKTQFSICTTADRKVVYTYSGLPEMTPKGDTNEAEELRRQLKFGDPRFHYVPWAGLIVALDWAGEKVYLRKLDLKASLTEKGAGELFVDSVPPDTFSPGTTFTYAIGVSSKSGQPQFKLESGPTGMTVSAKGVVTWAVPGNFDDDNVKAIVSVTDGGEEVLHTIDLNKQAAPARSGKRK